MAQEPAPCLPMEILEEIVGFHGNKEQGKPSATLLACLATSSQFRACALRHLCAEVPVYLDRSKQLRRLRDCMLSAEFCHRLTSVEIVISSTTRPEVPHLREENILPLLEILSRQAPLRAVTFQARNSMWGLALGGLSWTELPLRTRVSLRSLSQVPTVTMLAFRWFRDVPPEFFSQQPYQSITHADGHTSSSGLVTELNTTSLVLETAYLKNVALPLLRHIKTRCHLESYYHSTWHVIKHTLETIQVGGKDSFPMFKPSTKIAHHMFYINRVRVHPYPDSSRCPIPQVPKARRIYSFILHLYGDSTNSPNLDQILPACSNNQQGQQLEEAQHTSAYN